MIKSEIVEIGYIKSFDDEYIEVELAKKYTSVVRWAIVEISDKIVVSVSFED